jgi:hypothetical protein
MRLHSTAALPSTAHSEQAKGKENKGPSSNLQKYHSSDGAPDRELFADLHLQTCGIHHFNDFLGLLTITLQSCFSYHFASFNRFYFHIPVQPRENTLSAAETRRAPGSIQSLACAPQPRQEWSLHDS